MESEGLMRGSHEPATKLKPEPDESNPQSTILFL
jgi:hypothetical protein